MFIVFISAYRVYFNQLVFLVFIVFISAYRAYFNQLAFLVFIVFISAYRVYFNQTGKLHAEISLFLKKLRMRSYAYVFTTGLTPKLSKLQKLNFA